MAVSKLEIAIGLSILLVVSACGTVSEPTPPVPIPAPTAVFLGPTPTPASSPPIAPTFLKAELDKDFPGIILTWQDMSDNESLFLLDRMEDSGTGSWEGAMVTNNDETSLLDSFVVEGARYCYRVRAKNSAGSSKYSNALCITFDIR